MQNASHYIENNSLQGEQVLLHPEGTYFPIMTGILGINLCFSNFIFRLSCYIVDGETVEGPKKKTQDDENVPVDNGGGGAAFTSFRFLAVQSNSLLSLNTIPTRHTHSFFSTFHLLVSL